MTLENSNASLNCYVTSRRADGTAVSLLQWDCGTAACDAMPRNLSAWYATDVDALSSFRSKNNHRRLRGDRQARAENCLRQNPGVILQMQSALTRRDRVSSLRSPVLARGPAGGGRSSIPAIGLTNTALDCVATRAAIPGPPPAADRTAIWLTHTALDRVTGRAAIPGPPAGAITVAIPVGRWRIIVLRVGRHRASQRCSNTAREQKNSGLSAHKPDSSLCHRANVRQ
jgi:hypothetical protein